MIYNRTSMKLTSKYDITARRQSVFVVTLDLWTKKRMQQIQMIQDFSPIHATFNLLPTILIDLSTIFYTFDMGQLRKLRRRNWKERLKICKIAKFKSDTS